ncbi:MAG: hypothetical protein AAF604_06895 [Acidobacteriota bacterium]
MRHHPLLLVCALLLLPSAASGRGHDLELRVQIDGETIDFSNRWGSPLVVASGTETLWIVPHLEADGTSLDVHRADLKGELLPLSKVELPPWGTVRLPMLDATVELLSWTPSTSDFRPRNCCIWCGENIMCGGCVDHHGCGTCCVE